MAGLYTDNFLNYVHDFTGDGWPDYLKVNFNGAYLYVNPKGESRYWPMSQVTDGVSSETTQLGDIDGDGKPELLMSIGSGASRVIGFSKPGADPTAALDVPRRVRQGGLGRTWLRLRRHQRRRQGGHHPGQRLVGTARRRRNQRPVEVQRGAVRTRHRSVHPRRRHVCLRRQRRQAARRRDQPVRARARARVVRAAAHRPGTRSPGRCT